MSFVIGPGGEKWLFITQQRGDLSPWQHHVLRYNRGRWTRFADLGEALRRCGTTQLPGPYNTMWHVLWQENHGAGLIGHAVWVDRWRNFRFSGFNVPPGASRWTCAIDPSGVRWFRAPTMRRGNTNLFSYDGTRWRAYDNDDVPILDRINALAIDGAGRKWFGTPSGLACFDGHTWRTWTGKDGLAGGSVRQLAVDVDGSIWVGTTTGLSHIVLKRKE